MISLTSDVADYILRNTLSDVTNGLNSSILRMTSGYKINQAKDNAANFSISADLSKKISSMLQVQNNIGDGISLLNTAEGGLENIQTLLGRLKELATQAANGTYDILSRDAMQQEADAIIEQIEKIKNTINFNGINLYEKQKNIGIKSYTNKLAKSVNIAGTVNDEINNFTPVSATTGGRALARSSAFSSPISTYANNIEGAVDIAAGATKTINIDGVDYTITNRISSVQSISYLKDSTTGEITFLGNQFTIKGQTDVAHNLIISGSNNIVYGGNLDDTIAVNGSNNTICGNKGNDTLTSLDGSRNSIYGGGGNDAITFLFTKNPPYGGWGYGESGDDVLTSTVYATVLEGGAGNDVFNLKSSSVTAYGQEGDDEFIVEGKEHYIDGGSGNNKITDTSTDSTKINVPGVTDFAVEFNANETKAITINDIEYTVTNQNSKSASLVYSINNGQITFNSQGVWKIRGEENKAHNVWLRSGSISFYGGNLNDTIVGSINHVIYANGGDNYISILNTRNRIITGDGNNIIDITGSGSENTIQCGNGNNTINFVTNTGHHTNYIELGSGDNTINIKGYLEDCGIYGGSGSNNKLIGSVRDSLIAGFDDSINNANVIDLSNNASKDIIVGDKKYSAAKLSDTAYTNTCLYSYNSVSEEFKFAGAHQTLTLQKDVKNNITTFGQGLYIYGGDMGDTITTNSYRTFVYGGVGNDNITVNRSNTIARGGDGDDTITINADSHANGEGGNDTIIVNNTGIEYKIDGGEGDDKYIINTSKGKFIDNFGNNIYYINPDGVYIIAGNGHDSFYIKGNNNTVLGSGGDDYFVIDGNNNIIDGGTENNYYVNNGTGTTLTNVNKDPNSGKLIFNEKDELQIFTLDGKTYKVKNNALGSNTIEYSLNPNTGVITINGSDVTIDAEENEKAILNIRGDNNIINGSNLDDIITIEQGSGNIINGNDGNDTFTTEFKNNSLIGGAGNDILNIKASTNLEISGGDGDDTINVSSDNNTNINSGSGNDTITISGKSNTIKSNDGNNHITVTGKDNNITAGNGDNRLIISSSGNTITAGSGSNKLNIQGSDNNITAQNVEGNIDINGSNNTLTSTRGDNTITIKGDNNTLTSVIGKKDITVAGDSNNITTGNNDDKFNIKGNQNTIESTGGDNKVTIKGDSNSYQGGVGIDDITINGNTNTAKGGDSDDKFTISNGNGNSIDGENGDRNTAYNYGTNTTINNVIDLTPNDFEVNIKVDIGSSENTYIRTKIGFSLRGLTIDLSSRESALSCLNDIDDLIKRVNEQLVNIGTTLNRLQYAAEAQTLKLNNLISTRSTIRDADIAKESSNYIRYQILQQASATLLATSRNLKAENVLGLLNNIHG